MGGKGGDDGGGTPWQAVYAPDDSGMSPRPKGNGERGYYTIAEWAQKQANDEAAKKNTFTAVDPPITPPPPEPTPTPTPEPTPAPPVEPLGPPISAGEPIPQPQVNSPFGAGAMMNTGDALGGAVVKPPAFWMGGTGQGRGKSRMTTTQT
jgi:hypothetical protein